MVKGNNTNESSVVRITQKLNLIKSVFAILIIVVICIVAYGAYVTISNITADIKGAAEIALDPKERVCKPEYRPGPVGGHLCYEKCKTGYKTDGALRCYEIGPDDWKGDKTGLMHLKHDTIYSPVGADASKSIPRGCSPEYEEHAGLCYKNPDPDKKEYKSPGVYGYKCPDGYRWGPINCTRDLNITYGHIFGWKAGDGAFNYKPAHQRCLNSEYGKKHGCTSWGCCAWRHNCEPGRTWNGTGCVRPISTKPSGWTSVVGNLPNKCPDNRVLQPGGRLCYPKCPDKYERRNFNVEYCTTICPPNWENTGISGCKRPFYTIPAGGSKLTDKYGQCPPGYPNPGKLGGLLCYKDCPKYFEMIDDKCVDQRTTMAKVQNEIEQITNDVKKWVNTNVSKIKEKLSSS